MSSLFLWNCPYCDRNATITSENYSADTHKFDKNNKDGDLAIFTTVVTCPNEKCREYSVTATLAKVELKNGAWKPKGNPLLKWKLRPQSKAKPYPDFVPAPIRSDYEEACLIQDLSPKASATLSRRCLQGMIRDFWKIHKKRLLDEIKALENKVDPLTWSAIDAVRQVGNIGAHMEKDINVIVDVEPNEAEMLIGLVETLIRDWYIAREQRKQQLSDIVKIAEGKKEKGKQSNIQIQPTGEAGG